MALERVLVLEALLLRLELLVARLHLLDALLLREHDLVDDDAEAVNGEFRADLRAARVADDDRFRGGRVGTKQSKLAMTPTKTIARERLTATGCRPSEPT